MLFIVFSSSDPNAPLLTIVTSALKMGKAFPPKRWYLPTCQHGATTQNAVSNVRHRSVSFTK
jgi:hypothetical protein